MLHYNLRTGEDYFRIDLISNILQKSLLLEGLRMYNNKEIKEKIFKKCN